MWATKREIIFGVIGGFVFVLVLTLAILLWSRTQESKYDQTMRKILESVSLPESASFKDYALKLEKEIKPGYTVVEVHKVMRGYSRIETFPTYNGFVEYYRYDLGKMDEIFPGPTAIIIEYDSTWNYKSFQIQS